MIVGNCFEIWLAERWEELLTPSGFVTTSSPPGYFVAKTKLDREKAQEHLETYAEFEARMKAHNPLADGPIIYRQVY